jgi:predicted DNA-binding protein
MPGGIFVSTLTIRLPDSTAERLKTLAQSRGQSVNKLIEEMSAQALAVFDAETRFRAFAAQGNATQALAILDRLDGRKAKSRRKTK